MFVVECSVCCELLEWGGEGESKIVVEPCKTCIDNACESVVNKYE